VIVCDSFVIADWSDPSTHPGRPIAPLHVHRSDDEAWIVLEVRLDFRVGERECEVLAGDSLLVSRGDAALLLEPRLPARALTARHDAANPSADRGAPGQRPQRLREDLREHDSELLA